MTAEASARPERLPGAPWLHAASTRKVVQALEAQGGPGAARFVGGCVRDTLLQRPAATSLDGGLDIDIATPLAPPRVVAALQAAGLKAVPTGIEHGTVTAVSRGRPYEITTLRRDVETDGRHAVVAFTTDWGEDAARRDFRLNALYAEPDGRLHDPTGGGVADALAGRIVFVGDPETRIREDYLRILRFFRFLAWYGREAPNAAGLAACGALAAGLRTLSAERVSKELLKLLGAPDPRPSIHAMAEAGVMAELPLESDVRRLDRVVALEAALGRPADAGLRLAALARTPASDIAKRLRLSNALRDRLAAAVGELPPAAALDPPAVRAAVYRSGRTAVEDRLLLQAEVGEAARLAPLLALAQGWTPPAFPIGGVQIKAAGAPPGPAIGRVWREVEDWWVAHDFPDDPAALEAALGAAVARARAPGDQG